ncbi:MAG: hypothetical protein HOL22_00045 [Euryarchaeota archaeon]|jgi:hypothetical protein|nr:hypothetical protein [Euryarchaeota archaeon]MBT5594480.1 hypothetical protein [Euryarchaeota archaeon]MBT5844867.1 hypothetical protein [Euryarchaeota archaeon]MBT6640223.1 hypothetical protein [Euryarchaeota archaeon]MBT6845350.1 hypothetical protein [Euryarchaeota archaeon]
MTGEKASAVDGMVTLQERMVNLINQLNMPLIEVSLVLSKHIAGLSRSLDEHISATQQEFPDTVTHPWVIENPESDGNEFTFDLDKILKIIDADRMDILATLIRVTLVEIDASLAEGLLALRPWEALSRTQLSKAKGPGQLFSPLEIPEDW